MLPLEVLENNCHTVEARVSFSVFHGLSFYIMHAKGGWKKVAYYEQMDMDGVGRKLIVSFST